jgi:hypothetical protein
MSANVAAIYTATNVSPRTLIATNLSDFLDMEITPQEAILEPWLNTKSLNMLHAKRGVGKTHMGLAIAYAVATGTSYLRWKAPQPRKVVYLDGEMSSFSLQSRLKAISEATACDPTLLDNLRIFTPDLQCGPIPDLAERGWHLAVRELIDDAELVVVDNLSCLARSGGQENDSDSWDVMSEWALGLRREGVAVLFMHHSGKNGQQRGTSRREDILNVVINLKHPADYSSEKGAQFEVHFEKGRELYGEDSKPFLAQMLTKEGLQYWEIEDLDASTFDQVVAMTNLDMSMYDIAAELGVNKSTVSRYQKRAKEEGLIKKTS